MAVAFIKKEFKHLLLVHTFKKGIIALSNLSIDAGTSENGEGQVLHKQTHQLHQLCCLSSPLKRKDSTRTLGSSEGSFFQSIVPTPRLPYLDYQLKSQMLEAFPQVGSVLFPSAHNKAKAAKACCDLKTSSNHMGF